MIEVTELSKKYGANTAVDNISFKIDKGEIVGFLGPNGAGKSTTMNMITGYLSPTSGTVTVDGFDILDRPDEAKKKIGYLPEIPPLYLDMTAYEYLDFLCDLKKTEFKHEDHINEICRLVKIDHLKNRLIKKLSKGYRQRVGIAAALVGNPEILILDEPTVGLDPAQIIEIRKLIKALGKTHTVILSSHILPEIESVCKRIIIINGGKIVADGLSEDICREMSSDMTLTAIIEGGRDEIVSLIESNLPAVVDKVKKDGDNAYRYEIKPKNGKDIRRDLFLLLAANKHPLIGLTGNKMSLEDVFMKLTGNGDGLSDNGHLTDFSDFTEDNDTVRGGETE